MRPSESPSPTPPESPAPAEAAPRRWQLETEGLLRELDIGWSAGDQAALAAELAPYTDALDEYLASGAAIPTHIAGSPALCAPVTSIGDPAELFAGAAGEVAEETWTAVEHADYWITLHYSTVPVVMLLLKRPPQRRPKLDDLCRRAAARLDRWVGGDTGIYLQWSAPGYWWPLHTDDDFEAVDLRLHLPFRTSEQSLFAWAETIEAERDQWVHTRHLEAGKVYCARVDVPHTAGNDHPTDGRVHLILDVGPAGSAG